MLIRLLISQPPLVIRTAVPLRRALPTCRLFPLVGVDESPLSAAILQVPRMPNLDDVR